MANSCGGFILLGVRERRYGQFEIAGIQNVEKIRTALFDLANNRNKVSLNLLTDQQVFPVIREGKTVLIVRVPQATRKQKPIFLNGNPLGNTYKRLHDGDRVCSDEDVKRMLAEQMEDDRDRKILEHFGMTDLNADSLRIYRQMFKDEKPKHPFLDLDDFEFLKKIVGWRYDRETEKEGLTLAGLLMLGDWSAIQEALPYYFLDYQEKPEVESDIRWLDRLVPDGSWSGNLFDFYHRVYRKLIVDLKIPFAIRGGQRRDDTLVHQALREALVNTFVHADYMGRASIVVIKNSMMFRFRNPGHSRLPLEQVRQGGESDCRNPLLQQMFLMIGLGEKAGSGMPKIMKGWTSQHWRKPHIYEKDEPEQTVLELHMLDLLPTFVLEDLHERFGAAFDALDQNERLILATAVIEKVITHNRLLEISDQHAHDLSVQFSRLIKQGFLESDGRKRGKVYYLRGETLLNPDEFFDEGDEQKLSSEHLSPSSEHLSPSSEHLLKKSFRNQSGCLVNAQLDAPLIDSLEKLDFDLKQQIEQIIKNAPTRKKLGKLLVEQIILQLCTDYYLTLGVLAELLGRHPNGLRQRYLNRMTKSQQIRLAFPQTPTHERQAYRANALTIESARRADEGKI